MERDAEQWLVSRLAHRLNRCKGFLDLCGGFSYHLLHFPRSSFLKPIFFMESRQDAPEGGNYIRLFFSNTNQKVRVLTKGK